MDTTEKLARLVLDLANVGGLDTTVNALKDGSLTRNAGAATRGRIASGRRGVETLLKKLDALWTEHPDTLDASEFALMLEAIAAGVRVERQQTPTTEVVWTGPDVQGTYLRATRQVVQDIIQNAESKLLVVGYWIAGRGDSDGIIQDVIAQMADAVKRGVTVTMVLERKEQSKESKKTNRDILIDLWPKAVPLPTLLTWVVPANEKHMKLHAKVLVADEHDALVTSANLTMHALDKNMEMGVRIKGSPAANITKHFDLLRQDEVLVTFE